MLVAVWFVSIIFYFRASTALHIVHRGATLSSRMHFCHQQFLVRRVLHFQHHVKATQMPCENNVKLMQQICRMNNARVLCSVHAPQVE